MPFLFFAMLFHHQSDIIYLGTYVFAIILREALAIEKFMPVDTR